MSERRSLSLLALLPFIVIFLLPPSCANISPIQSSWAGVARANAIPLNPAASRMSSDHHDRAPAFDLDAGTQKVLRLRGGQEDAKALRAKDGKAEKEAKVDGEKPAQPPTEAQLANARTTKDAGNAAFQDGQYAIAMNLYDRACNLTNGIEVQTEAELEAVQAVQLACLTNKALAALQLQDYAQAIECCSIVLEYQPGHYKALFRRAQALQIEAAAADLQRIVEVHGDTGEVREAIAKLQQALFHIPAFRRAIYHIPTAPPQPGQLPSVPLAMQRLFWLLQKTREAQSTTELLASFGWDSGDALQQQDISDFCHMLFDLVDDSMKNTTVHDEITRLYGAKVQYTDEAKAVQWKKHREDTSMVTLLHGVKECKDVAASLELVTAPEVIEGYNTEVHGKQTVERRMQFKKLPPVLMLNINRIDFCPVRLEPVKLNDRFEFHETLDLAPFVVREEGEGDTSSRYKLRSVIVHMGTANMGHYVAYCRPAKSEAGGDGWYCMDDDLVATVTADEAVRDNYGSEKQPQIPAGSEMLYGRAALLKMRSAYMLMYVREDMEEAVMNVTNIDEEVPVHVREMDAGSRTVSLPQSFTIRIHSAAMPTGAAAAGAEATVEAVGASGVLRGTPVNITIADAASKTVGDLLATLEEACKAMGTPLEPPSAEDFLGGVPEIGEQGTIVEEEEEEEEEEAMEGGQAGERGGKVGAPELGLCLTLMRNHMVHEVYPDEAPLGEVEGGFVLRAEWVDRQRAARQVRVMHFAEAAAEAAEAEAEGAAGEEGEEGGGAGAPRAVSYERHGDPTVFTVYLGETVGSARRRLLKTQGLEDTPETQLAWVTWNSPPFFMTNATDVLLPMERLLEQHWLGLLRRDPGTGPTTEDFWAGNVLGMVPQTSGGTQGVRLKASK